MMEDECGVHDYIYIHIYSLLVMVWLRFTDCTFVDALRFKRDMHIYIDGLNRVKCDY